MKQSSKSRGKESTDSGSQLNSLQLNSEIVGTSQVDCDLGNQKKKKGKEVTFWRRVRQYQTKIQNCSSTTGLSDLRLQCFDTCSKEGATTLMELCWHDGDYLTTSANLATQPLKYKVEDERNQIS